MEAIIERNDQDKWDLEVTEPLYLNHGLLSNPKASASTRKLYKDDTFIKLVNAHLKAGIAAKHTYTTFQQREPGTAITMRDIRNERARQKFMELKGDTPITAFFKALVSNDDEVSDFFFRYRTQSMIEAGGGPLTHLFLTHWDHSELLTQNPEVLILDATYKTNRFRMPLVNIYGMTPTNRTFFAGSVFLPSEKQYDYCLVFLGIRALYKELGIPQPETF